MARANGATFANARDPLIRSATNSTTSDHTSQVIAQNHTAQRAFVPNVDSAIVCASERSVVSSPFTI